jgi:hypothetical protein
MAAEYVLDPAIKWDSHAFTLEGREHLGTLRNGQNLTISTVAVNS